MITVTQCPPNATLCPEESTAIVTSTVDLYTVSKLPVTL